MHSFLQQYQEVFLTLLKMKTKIFERIPFFRVYINLYVRAKRRGEKNIIATNYAEKRK